MPDPSKYAENQFLAATVERFPLVTELFSDIKPKIAAAAALNSNFAEAEGAVNDGSVAWDAGEIILSNAEAGQLGATDAFADKMDSVTRKPDINSNSPITAWDLVIQTQVAYQSPAYTTLLPQGRETLTGSTYEENLTAGHAFAVRLGQQGTLLSKPALNTLGATVATFYNAAQTLRNLQGTAEAAVDAARDAQEVLRVASCAAFILMVGAGLVIWNTTTALVDTLFDVNMLRGPIQDIPAEPLDSHWVAGTKTLSTTVMPDGATRLELLRQGPGGAVELLLVGATGELALTVPAEFTFDPGDVYQLWLQGRNSRGSSLPGPKQSWTAT